MAYNFEYPYTDISRANSDWLLARFKELTHDYTELIEWKNHHIEQYNELKKLYNDVMSGKFPKQIVDGINDYLLHKGGVELLGSLVKGVYFGLTDSGYFVAYIPETWDDIVFKTTGYDDLETSADFGHLELFMDV